MKKYLVTGGCGFIGSHLCDALLKRGDKVIVLDNLSFGKRENLSSEAELIIGDIQNATLVNKVMSSVDGCFHLAAITSVELSNQDWIGTHQTNLTGTIVILNAARSGKEGKSIPVVYASSSAIYGSNKNLPLAESATPEPMTAYAADKLGCEFHARVAPLSHGIATVGLRLFNVYGPRQDPRSVYSGVISIFLEHLMQNKLLEIYGDGQQTRDFIYVADVVKFFLAAMEKLLRVPEQPDCYIYNACTGHSTTIEQLALLLAQMLEKPLEIIYAQARKGDVRNSLGDPKKSLQELSIASEYSLLHGLSELVDYLHKHSD